MLWNLLTLLGDDKVCFWFEKHNQSSRRLISNCFFRQSCNGFIWQHIHGSVGRLVGEFGAFVSIVVDSCSEHQCFTVPTSNRRRYYTLSLTHTAYASKPKANECRKGKFTTELPTLLAALSPIAHVIVRTQYTVHTFKRKRSALLCSALFCSTQFSSVQFSSVLHPMCQLFARWNMNLCDLYGGLCVCVCVKRTSNATTQSNSHTHPTICEWVLARGKHISNRRRHTPNALSVFYKVA